MKLIFLALPLIGWDFSEGPGGFSATGDGAQWEWGVPSTAPGGSVPVWGTVLDGLYLNDAVDDLHLPTLALDAVARPVLRFRHWYRVAPGDRATVEVNDGTGWVRAEPIYGYPHPDGYVGAGAWAWASVDLSGLGPAPGVRFRLDTDATFADAGWYLSQVELFDGDITPPRFGAVIEPEDTQDLAGPYPIVAEVEDDVEVQQVLLRWSAGGGEQLIALQPGPDEAWSASIEGLPPGTEVSWSLEATDTSGNVAMWPEGPDRQFRVYLAAPTGLRAVTEGRPIGPVVELTWEPPDSPHPVVGYHLMDVQGELPPVRVVEPPAELHVESGGPVVWQVAAEYAAGLGDLSAPVTIDPEIPAIIAIEPSAVLPGETRHLRVRGSSLYLHAQSAALSLGPDLRVVEVQVRDADTLDALVEIDPAAQPGPRTAVITGSHGELRVEDALRVVDGELPRVVEVQPARVVQGATERIAIRANVPLAGPLKIEHPDGMVLRGEPTIDEDRIWIEVGVHSDAPVGTYSLILDDGVRRLVADLDVERRIYSGQRRCATGPGSIPGAGALALILGLMLRRRRR